MIPAMKTRVSCAYPAPRGMLRLAAHRRARVRIGALMTSALFHLTVAQDVPRHPTIPCSQHAVAGPPTPDGKPGLRKRADSAQ